MERLEAAMQSGGLGLQQDKSNSAQWNKHVARCSAPPSLRFALPPDGLC